MTNEQIAELKRIVDGAPDESEVHSSEIDYYFFQKLDSSSVLMGSLLRTIIAQHEEIERLRDDFNKAMNIVNEVVDRAIESSDIYPDELQNWLVKEGFLQTVPFDPRKHYDYTNETQEGQDWVAWSNWYAKLKGESE